MTMDARITAACDRTGHALLRALAAAFLLLTFVLPARADWTVAAYLGASLQTPDLLISCARVSVAGTLSAGGRSDQSVCGAWFSTSQPYTS